MGLRSEHRSPIRAINDGRRNSQQVQTQRMLVGTCAPCMVVVKLISAFRVFYTCPLGRDDPTRCKFFKWADELDGTDNAASTPKRPKAPRGGGQTLGQSPMAAYGRPRPPPTPSDRAGPSTTRPTTAERQSSMSDDEIDWEQVDTDDLEREAIASTPGSSQRTASQSQTPIAAPGSTYRERMRAAVEDGLGKRKREEEDDAATPKRSLEDVSDTARDR